MARRSTTLTERQRCVLQAIVRLYIRTGQPISSRLLARHLRTRLRVSAATLRTVMAELEEMGYLQQPHTSAGRIPTDRGYRAYIDSLVGFEPLRDEEQDFIARELQARDDYETLLQGASRVLSTLAAAVGITRSPAPQQLTLHRFELISVSSTHVLVILIFQPTLVRTFLLETPWELTPNTAERLTQFLNERFAGLPFATMMYTAVPSEMVSSLPEPMVNFIERLWEQLPSLLHPLGRLYVSGTSQLLRYPEYASTERLRTLTLLLEESSLLQQLFSQYEEQLQQHPLFIGIGRELRLPALHDSALILHRYPLGSSYGVVGIIGPKRMPYARVIPAVSCVAQRLADLCA